MILEIASLTFLLAEMAYHRWHTDKTPAPIKPQEVSIPRVDAGAPVPLIFGRCRVRAPILAWTDTPIREVGTVINGWPAGVVFYRMNMFFVLGIGMADGNATSKIHGMWSGDRKFSTWGAATKETAITTEVNAADADQGPVGSQAFYYDGNASQDVGATTGGIMMTNGGTDVFQIPAYFGYLSVALYGDAAVTQQWIVGSSPNVAAYSFEASSYKDSGGYPAVGIYAQVGLDSNPINVLYDVLVAQFGKLGLSTSLIDMTSFQHAATVLYNEGHGYSRCIDSEMTADEIIQDILRQIDAALDEDPETGKLVITLVRPDFDPSELLEINRSNCEKLTDFVASGWTGLQSTIVLSYTNRAKDYTPDTVVDHNQGNATEQGEIEPLAIEMVGITEEALARVVAAREKGARSRPITKFRALVGREFAKKLRGQPVKVTWDKPGISGQVFRIANVNRGTLDDGKVSLDLVSDFFYTYRGRPPRHPPGGFGGLGFDGLLTGG